MFEKKQLEMQCDRSWHSNTVFSVSYAVLNSTGLEYSVKSRHPCCYWNQRY